MNTELPETTWLTIPDLVEALGLTQSQVRRAIEENELVAARVDGVLKVPADFIAHGEPMPEIKGTVILLRDYGFSDEELITWLLSEEESLGVSPIDALKAGRKAEVRRIAQALL